MSHRESRVPARLSRYLRARGARKRRRRLEGRRVPQHHGPTAGVLCTKVARYTERTYHPERLLHPLRRVGKKGEGRFERISWEEAIATHRRTARRHRRRRIPRASCRTAMPAPWVLCKASPCLSDFFTAWARASSTAPFAQPRAPRATASRSARASVWTSRLAEEANLIIFWGCNAITSSVHFWARAQEAKRSGARLIAIDPVSLAHGREMPRAHRAAPRHRRRARARPHARAHSRRPDRPRLRRAPHTRLRSPARTGARFDPARVAAICGITAGEHRIARAPLRDHTSRR